MESVRKLIDKYGMLPRGGKVIAAVSGGADSMCLLHLLLDLREEYGYELIAAHFNHMLRGENADRDERFVKEQCGQLGVQVICGRGDTKTYAAEKGLGTEEAARELRYRFFEETARAAGASRVATAHTADDNAETVLMNVSRGAGLNGLCGIPPARGIYVRPMLGVTRDEVEEYLRERDIGHVEDETNSLDIYTRNRLRHEVMPVLKSINGGTAGNIFAMTELLRDDEDFLTSEAELFIEENAADGRVSIEKLCSLHPAVSSRVIRAMCPGAGKKHIDSVLAMCGDGASPSARCDLPGTAVIREYGDLIFRPDQQPGTFGPVFPEPGKTVEIKELGLEVSCEITGSAESVEKRFTTFIFKNTDICDKICVRSRKTGDSIKLSDNTGTKTLKKLFIEKKIPARMRENIPVIADGEKVLAVYGIGQDARYAASPGDEAIVIRFREIS